MKEIDRHFLIAFVILISSLSIYFGNITGFASVDNDISIREKTEARIAGIDYRSSITIYETQNITTELINTGSVSITGKIEEYIYIYSGGKLNVSAFFYDSSAFLNPGMRRSFKSVFVPTEAGIYYIKVRASYGNRVAEMWGLFTVSYPQTVTPATLPPIQIEVPQGGGSLLLDTARPSGVPKMDVKYPAQINLFQNDSILINVTINNTGETILRNLNLYVSTENFIDINVSPKQLSALGVNHTALFLISLSTSFPKPGDYKLEFSVISSDIMLEKISTLTILGSNVLVIEDLYPKIMNYKFLIIEIENDMLSASLSGFKVELANRSLAMAKSSLDKARVYYDDGDYENTKDELDNTKKNIEDAVFELANARIVIYSRPLPDIYLVIIFIIVFALLYLIASRIKKRHARRPKMLRESDESS